MCDDLMYPCDNCGTAEGSHQLTGVGMLCTWCWTYYKENGELP